MKIEVVKMLLFTQSISSFIIAKWPPVIPIDSFPIVGEADGTSGAGGVSPIFIGTAKAVPFQSNLNPNFLLDAIVLASCLTEPARDLLQ
jgi:hypothetical protein